MGRLCNSADLMPGACTVWCPVKCVEVTLPCILAAKLFCQPLAVHSSRALGAVMFCPEEDLPGTATQTDCIMSCNPAGTVNRAFLISAGQRTFAKSGRAAEQANARAAGC